MQSRHSKDWAAVGALLVLLGSVVPAGAQEPARDAPPPSTHSYATTDALFWTTMSLAVLHHTDHIVRGNHSGWPFTDEVTPMTPSLLVYPIYFGAQALDAGPLTFTLLDAATILGLAAVHLVPGAIEPPEDIHDPWADGTNETGHHSSAMGRAAQVVAYTLIAGAAAHLTSSIVDGARCGFTWKRRRCPREGAFVPAPLVAPGAVGAAVSVTF